MHEITVINGKYMVTICDYIAFRLTDFSFWVFYVLHTHLQRILDFSISQQNPTLNIAASYICRSFCLLIVLTGLKLSVKRIQINNALMTAPRRWEWRPKWQSEVRIKMKLRFRLQLTVKNSNNFVKRFLSTVLILVLQIKVRW